MAGVAHNPMIAKALDLLNAGDFLAAAWVCRQVLVTDKRNHQAMVLLGQVESKGFQMCSRPTDVPAFPSGTAPARRLV